MKILQLIYDDVDNPWIGGGGALRIRELYQWLGHWGHECTVLCGAYPNTRDRMRGNVQYLFRGRPSSYLASALTYVLAAYRHLICHGRAYDVVVEDYSLFCPLFAYPFARRPAVLQLQLFCPRRSFRKFGPVGPFLYAGQKLYPRCYSDAIYLNEALASRWPLGSQRRYHIRMGIPPHYLTYHQDPRQDTVTSLPAAIVGEQRPLHGAISGGYLLYLGRLEYSAKGLDVLRDACPRIWDSTPEARLVIAGAGRGENEVHRQYAELQRMYPGQVVFVGFVSGSQKERLLAGCKALVLPSREEGEGLCVLEAAAFGKPVVASSIQELLYVSEEGLGLNTVTGNPESLANGVARLYEDEELAMRLSRQARQWAGQHTWERKARDFEAALRQVVARA